MKDTLSRITKPKGHQHSVTVVVRSLSKNVSFCTAQTVTNWFEEIEDFMLYLPCKTIIIPLIDYSITYAREWDLLVGVGELIVLES